MKEKIVLVEWNIKRYLQAKVLIESTISNITQRPHVIDYYRYIQFAFDQLDEDSRTIIFNDFMAKKNRNWYLEFYSLSTYYRLRKIAILKFLDCLEGL